MPPYLLTRVAATATDRQLARCGHQTLLIDGRLRHRRDEVAPPSEFRETLLQTAASGRIRTIHDAGEEETLPGPVVRTDGAGPTGDVGVDEAYDHAGQVWNLFEQAFGRRSADGRGTPLVVTVHYGRNYDNAFWDGTQLVFGDGDGEVFDRFTKPMDVMAHELGHGVTQFTAGLVYQGQPGALNESVSDVFAAMAKQRAAGQDAAAADWLIGVGLFRPGVQARALRSMIEPGTAYDDPRLGRDPQAGSMSAYVETDDDNGGVHLNSGIPNRAFALAAIGLGGRSWERAGRIWYDALTGGDVGPQTDFAGFAAATMASATRLFGAAAAESVTEAWSEVGVLDQDGASAAPAPAGRPNPAEEPAPQSVAVKREGGFTGQVKRAELDLQQDPHGPEVRRLLARITVQEIAVRSAAPDRFVYTVRYGSWEVTVPEPDLTPELHRVVQLVLDDGG